MPNDKKMIRVSKLHQLKTQIGNAIKSLPNKDFPLYFSYREGMEDSEYVITIEAIDSEIFTDAKGQKWRKIDD